MVRDVGKFAFLLRQILRICRLQTQCNVILFVGCIELPFQCMCVSFLVLSRGFQVGISASSLVCIHSAVKVAALLLLCPLFFSTLGAAVGAGVVESEVVVFFVGKLEGEGDGSAHCNIVSRSSKAFRVVSPPCNEIAVDDGGFCKIVMISTAA